MTPVYNTGKRVLEECIASVLDQTESDWELCLVDDCSTDPGVRKVLQRAAALDRRIRVHFRSSNGGIVAASNDGLGMALGRYVGLLDHDDVLEPDALEEVFAALTVKPDIDYLYTDEDLLGEDGKTREAFRKPDWSPERFRNQMYVCHFSVIKRELLEAVGGFRPGFDGSQDYDLMLRVTESANVIHHIPKVLYHWRIVEGSVAGDPDAKPYAYTAGENALHDHCERVGIEATISSSRSLPGNYTIKRQTSATQTPVDLFFVNNDDSSRVWGWLRHHASETKKSLTDTSTYSQLTVHPLEPTVQSRLEIFNDAARASTSKYVVLASHRLMVDTPDWCEILEGFIREHDVGAVAPYIWTANSRLLHAGFNLRPHCIEHVGRGISKEFTGFRAIFKSDREVSGIGAYCTMYKRDVFIDAGGFDTTLPTPFAELDLSLRIRNLGYRIIATPQANMWCFDANADFQGARIRLTEPFHSRWMNELQRDAYAGLGRERGEPQEVRPKWHPRRLRHFK